MSDDPAREDQRSPGREDPHDDGGRARRRRSRPSLDPIRSVRVMGRFVRRQAKRPGSAPGTLVHTGPRKVEEVRIRFLDYDDEGLREGTVQGVADVWDLKDQPTVTWVNIDGLHDVSLVEAFGERFGIHPLVLEDIVSAGQRAKIEEHEDYLFLVVPMLSWDAGRSSVVEEQLSLVLGPAWVVTFQERYGDVFEGVRERIRTANRRIRQRGADYLAYALVDAVVDHYFVVLERIGETTEELELEVLDDPTPETMERLHRLKRELVAVRRAVSPVREVASGLVRGESALVEDATRVFLRDVNDHAVQAMDTVDSLRDVASGAMDLYLSHVGHRQNEIMKVLTVMASIFIPLTFLAGIYGMNFERMPELGIPWAYPALLGVMLVLGVGMLLLFRRRGWL